MKLMSWDYTMTACRYDTKRGRRWDGRGSVHCLNTSRDRNEETEMGRDGDKERRRERAGEHKEKKESIKYF